MKFEKIVGFTPVFLIPSAWIITFLQASNILGVASIKMMHLVMLAFLPVFLYIGWESLNEGVLKLWRNIIFAGLIFTFIGSLGLFFDLGASLTFFPDLIYWASIPSTGIVYTSWKAEWDLILLSAGLISTLGGILFTIHIHFAVTELWLPISLVGAGQTISIYRALLMHHS